jgi:hypothetical protein
LLDIEEDIVQDVEDVVLILGQHLPSHSNQKSTEEDALNQSIGTLMYSPKQRLVRDSLYSTFFARTPLSRKKCSRRRVVSTIVLGISYLIELIFKSQFLQISWALSGMLVPSRSLMEISPIFSSSYCGKARDLILLKTLIPNS